MSTIRLQMPYHLRTLAKVDGDIELQVGEPVTATAILEALEAKYPVLQGTIREHVTLKRREWIRYFACNEDISHDSPDLPLPDAIVLGQEPFIIVGAIAGG